MSEKNASGPGKPGKSSRKDKGQGQSNSGFWYLLVIGILAAVFITVAGRGTGGEEISYSEFLNRLETGTLNKDCMFEVSMGSSAIYWQDKAADDILKGKVTSVKRFYTPLTWITENNRAKLEDLLHSKAVVLNSAKPPSELTSMIPMLLVTALFILGFIFVLRRVGGAGSAMSFGRSRGRLYAQEDVNVTFNDVAGIDEAVEELKEIVEFLKTPQKYQALGGRIPRGVLLVGPPGTGKTMLARRLAGLLPPLTSCEALEVTRIQSIVGLGVEGLLATERPFRAPHHSISAAGLVGGGTPPSAGEATLAHRGVLFLDELSEFNRGALEALRQPLEDGEVTIVRGQQTVTFPTRFALVAATNPCLCGRSGGACRCSEVELTRHRQRLSGPLLDRLDIVVGVERPSSDALEAPPVTNTASVAARVEAARNLQLERGGRPNSQLVARDLLAAVNCSRDAARALTQAYDRGGLSARGRDRALRVARTVADLAGEDQVMTAALAQALGYRHENERLGNR